MSEVEPGPDPEYEAAVARIADAQRRIAAAETLHEVAIAEADLEAAETQKEKALSRLWTEALWGDVGR